MNGWEAALKVGVSYRQCDYWLRKGYLAADGRTTESPGSGNARSLTAGEYRRLERMAQLVRAGFTISAAAQIARAVADDPRNLRAVDLPGGVRVILPTAFVTGSPS